MSASLCSSLKKELALLEEKHLLRRLFTIEGEQGAWVTVSGRRMLNLSSNNYLGLASHPRLKQASAKAAQEYGCGSGASRLISGTMELHQRLEQRIAGFVKRDAALVFNSGYNANLGIISSLAGPGDTVFSDELNHASIVDGCRLSRAQVKVFAHNSTAALEAALVQSCQQNHSQRRLIVVESVFSMDGDIAPLASIVELAERFGCLVMVDEAHAIGTIGPGGRGLVASLGLEDKVSLEMGSLSKSLGSFGAYVSGCREVVDYLINTSRSFIFTTSLPPPVLAASLAAFDLLEESPSQVERVQKNAQYFRDGLNRLGFNTLRSRTQIIPVLVGEARAALDMTRLLQEEAVLAVAIRPPTIPEGTSRLRTSVMATHTQADLDLALTAFEKVGRHLKLI